MKIQHTQHTSTFTPKQELSLKIKNQIAQNENTLQESENLQSQVNVKLEEVKLQAKESQERTEKILKDSETINKENDLAVNKTLNDITQGSKDIIKESKEIQGKIQQQPIVIPGKTKVIVNIPQSSPMKSRFSIVSIFKNFVSFVLYMGKSVLSFFVDKRK